MDQQNNILVHSKPAICGQFYRQYVESVTNRAFCVVVTMWKRIL